MIETWWLAVAAGPALLVGGGFGWWLRSRRDTPEPDDERVTLPAIVPRRTALAAVDTVDDLVADAIRGLGSWVRTFGRDEQGALRLATDGTITVLFGDLVDSTAVNRELGDGAFATLLSTHDDRVRVLVGERGGRVVKTSGDGFMAAFLDPEEAARCGLELCDDTADRSTDDATLALRVGIHTGEAVTTRDDVFGEGVALAARIESAAEPGQVLVSEAMHDRLADVDDLVLDRRRTKTRLKGIDGRHRLTAVTRP